MLLHKFKVKINGIRIELAEIENALYAIRGIKQCAVLVRKDPNNKKHLVAYYVPSDNQEISETIFVEHLMSKLTIAMIPKIFINVKNHLPLTANGKLDFRTLPEPHFSIDTESYCPPRDFIEMKLCDLWADVLALSKIGIRDDFFKVGGDSILLMQLIERMRYELNFKVSMNDVLIYRTIEKLQGD